MNCLLPSFYQNNFVLFPCTGNCLYDSCQALNREKSLEDDCNCCTCDCDCDCEPLIILCFPFAFICDIISCPCRCGYHIRTKCNHKEQNKNKIMPVVAEV